MEISLRGKLAERLGLKVLIDDEDYDLIFPILTGNHRYKGQRRSWNASQRGKSKTCTYAVSTDGIYMHRLIMNPKDDELIDHINGDGLDNRRENLRICTSSQNHMNQRAFGRAKGVQLIRGKWRASISQSFNTKEEAILAYNDMALKVFGEFACPNVTVC